MAKLKIEIEANVASDVTIYLIETEVRKMLSPIVADGEVPSVFVRLVNAPESSAEMSNQIREAEEGRPRPRYEVVSSFCAERDHRSCAGCACSCSHLGWKKIRSKNPMRGVYLNG